MDDLRNELKSMFTSYWMYLTVNAACKLNLFDLIKSGKDSFLKLKNTMNADKVSLKLLLDALVYMEFIEYKGGLYFLNEKSYYLTDDHEFSLKNACVLWGMEHMDAWQLLDENIITGKPVFDNYFQYLSDKPGKLENYHKAMYEYAVEDYKDITKVIDFSKYNFIMDVGGGLGALITNIKKTYPYKRCTLFEMPEVIDLVNDNDIELIGGDFFTEVPESPDCIILSRVIHDWEDSKANLILKNCYDALQPDGHLIIIENFVDEIDDKASLLSLNMRLICKSYERSKEEYLKLLSANGFKFVYQKKLNKLQNILIVSK